MERADDILTDLVFSNHDGDGVCFRSRFTSAAEKSRAFSFVRLVARNRLAMEKHVGLTLLRTD